MPLNGVRCYGQISSLGACSICGTRASEKNDFTDGAGKRFHVAGPGVSHVMSATQEVAPIPQAVASEPAQTYVGEGGNLLCASCDLGGGQHKPDCYYRNASEKIAGAEEAAKRFFPSRDPSEFVVARGPAKVESLNTAAPQARPPLTFSGRLQRSDGIELVFTKANHDDVASHLNLSREELEELKRTYQVVSIHSYDSK
jgi:hypothetical protein